MKPKHSELRSGTTWWFIFGLLSDTVSWNCQVMGWIMSMKGCGRKLSWRNLRYYPGIFWGAEENHKTSCRTSSLRSGIWTPYETGLGRSVVKLGICFRKLHGLNLCWVTLSASLFPGEYQRWTLNRPPQLKNSFPLIVHDHTPISADAVCKLPYLHGCCRSWCWHDVRTVEFIICGRSQPVLIALLKRMALDVWNVW